MRTVLLALIWLTLMTPASAEEYRIPNPKRFLLAQETADTCWAASNRMLLASQGIEVSEAFQLMKVFGSTQPRGAGRDFSHAQNGLDGAFEGSDGSKYYVRPYVSYRSQRQYTDSEWILTSLRDGRPLVTTDSIHGYVIYGAAWQRTRIGDVINRVYLIDPLYRFDPVNHPAFQWHDRGSALFERLIGFMGFTVERLPETPLLNSRALGESETKGRPKLSDPESAGPASMGRSVGKTPIPDSEQPQTAYGGSSFCTAVKTVTDAASTGFRAIRGPFKSRFDGRNIYETTLSLGAYEGLITELPDQRSFATFHWYRSNNYGDVERKYEEILSALHECLSSDWELGTEQKATGGSTVRRTYIQPRVNGRLTGADISVTLVDDPKGGFRLDTGFAPPR